MNNIKVQSDLADCRAEINSVNILINGLGLSSAIVPFLTKYALIRACGCIETSFKKIIADYCDYRSKKQIKNFIARRIREGSANPSISNIYGIIKDFDESWKNTLKTHLSSHPDKTQIELSIQSLVDARNEFAHGGSPTVTIMDVTNYFDQSEKFIVMLDSVVV